MHRLSTAASDRHRLSCEGGRAGREGGGGGLTCNAGVQGMAPVLGSFCSAATHAGGSLPDASSGGGASERFTQGQAPAGHSTC